MRPVVTVVAELGIEHNTTAELAELRLGLGHTAERNSRLAAYIATVGKRMAECMQMESIKHMSMEFKLWFMEPIESTEPMVLDMAIAEPELPVATAKAADTLAESITIMGSAASATASTAGIVDTERSTAASTFDTFVGNIAAIVACKNSGVAVTVGRIR
jgi:hypothetical protein